MKEIVFLIGLLFCRIFAGDNVSLKIEPERQPTLEMRQEFSKVLTAISYPREYAIDVFDCTNQAAYLHDYLTVRDYRCRIFIGASKESIIPPKLGWHTWLVVEYQGKEFWIEPVYKVIIYPDFYEDYFIRSSFSSLEKARKFYEVFGYLAEWDY